MIWLLANRTAAEVLAAVLLIGGFAWHERNMGAVQCARADVARDQAATVRNLELDRRDADAINREIQARQAALLVPVSMPVVSLCRYPATVDRVPPARGATVRSDAETSRGGGNKSDFRGVADVGKPLGEAGRRADVQLAMLQNYVLDVCLKADGR